MPLAPAIAITTADPSDGREMNDYLREMYARERHLITRRDEVSFGPISQRKWIRQKLDNPLTTILVAKDMDQDGRLAGMLDSWTDARARVRHVTSFAMTVHKDYRRQGIGRALLGAFAHFVSEHPVLEKIELHVHRDNLGARHLYESVGFVLEGERREAVRYEDGRVVDDLLMAYWPNRPNTYGPQGGLTQGGL